MTTDHTPVLMSTQYDLVVDGISIRVTAPEPLTSYEGWEVIVNGIKHAATSVTRYRDGGTTIVRTAVGVLVVPSKYRPHKEPTWTPVNEALEVGRSESASLRQAPATVGECTSLTATSCPIHGDCECGNLDDDHCPLHAPGNTHAAHGDIIDKALEVLKKGLSEDELVELGEELDGTPGSPLLDRLDEYLMKVRPELFASLDGEMPLEGEKR